VEVGNLDSLGRLWYFLGKNDIWLEDVIDLFTS